jgi:hypothetical protein
MSIIKEARAVIKPNAQPAFDALRAEIGCSSYTAAISYLAQRVIPDYLKSLGQTSPITATRSMPIESTTDRVDPSIPVDF